MELALHTKQGGNIWYSEWTEENFSKGDGWGRLQGFPEKDGDEKIACKGFEEGEIKGSDHWCV